MCRASGGGFCLAINAASAIETRRVRDNVGEPDRGAAGMLQGMLTLDASEGPWEELGLPVPQPEPGADEVDHAIEDGTSGGRVLAALVLRMRYL